MAAISGDFLNYNVGKKMGLVLFRNPDSRVFNRRHLQQATEFYQRHGGKTVILARFLPIIRTYAPFVAGVSQMKWRRYLVFNITGAFLWTWSFLVCRVRVRRFTVSSSSAFHLVILAIMRGDDSAGVAEIRLEES